VRLKLAGRVRISKHCNFPRTIRTGFVYANGTGRQSETIRHPLSGDIECDHPDRLSFSRDRCQGIFFTSQVGDMLGDIRLAPAILFYPLYVVGILVFVGAPATATWQSALLYGALFGCVAMRRSNLPLLARAVDRSVRRTDDAMPYLSSA
jgi:hypothetical protein